MKSLLFVVLLLISSCSSTSDAPKPQKKKPNLVREALISAVPKFRTCYEQELSGKINTLDGVVTFKFTVGKNGIVQKTKVVPRSKLSRDLRICLTAVLGTIQFPRPVNGISIDVVEPFNIYPEKK